MSSDFYFKKWKNTLVNLEALVHLDMHFQKTKAHDKKRCGATQRLTGVLGRYMAVYNDIWQCWHQNLQAQKTHYIHDVMKAVVSRILELKHELKKLEVSEYHFGSNGLMLHKLTPNDAKLEEMPDKNERPESVQIMLEDIFKTVKEKKLQLEEKGEKEEQTAESVIKNWWEIDETEESEEDSGTDEQTVKLSEQQLETNKMVELIQAQEKTRQVIILIIQNRNKRQRWEKELCGILPPPASNGMKERAAKLIQKVCRAYFELKRQKLTQCKRDERLGIRPCLKQTTKFQNIEKLEQVKMNREKLKRQYDEELKKELENRKQQYLERKGDEFKEDCRDYIRDWFKIWYEAILFFHDIPDDGRGGAALIFKDELPTPEEWLEEYKVYLIEKTANRNKTTLHKKFAQMEAKREEMERKREERMKMKIETELRRKMMKNPKMHPGFVYPESKNTEHVLEVIDNYYRDWAELDATGRLDVKEKSVKEVNVSKAYMEAQIEIVATVEGDMKNELILLKQALKKDYENNGEKMPEPVKQKIRKGKKKRKVKTTLSRNIAEKLEDLVFRGIVTEYPKIKIEDFIGDPNFLGDDMRCDYVTAVPQNWEVRNVWWEKCRELSHGFHTILLVGPRGCGKNRLVHILATMNDAVLFELDPKTILEAQVTGAYLDHLVHAMASCARAVQPSVIHIKHVHRLYYRKVPPEDAGLDWKILQRFFVKKLLKYIHKTDNVTVIGTSVDPWMTKSQPLLKQFPTVVLLPNISYGTVVEMLKDWVLSHPVIPPDFNVSCLAHVLQGYSYGYIKDVLDKFLAAETIVRIAARGVSPMDVYDFIIQDETVSKVDYEKYLKWYFEKTTWGKREQKHLEEQRKFKQAMVEFLQRMEKKKLDKSSTIHNATRFKEGNITSEDEETSTQ